jgi:muramoyltetrapeptide carboxypeptidase
VRTQRLAATKRLSVFPVTPMAHIYVYSPSGAVRNAAGFRRAIKRLQQRGHAVEVDPDALTTWQRFAGDDAARLAAIGRAADSGADVTLLSRGGYGLTRILPQLPWKKIIKAIENGTQFVGLSDFTALQTALLTKTATQPAVTWAGNLLIDDWGQIAEPDEITEACFSEMVQGSSEGAGWIISKKEQPETGTALLKKPVKNATLWGGNLCVLTSLLGTPYFPSIKKGVLFLEDVSEHPYRIERMLTQLLHAGVLDNQQAVILGQFTDFQTSTHDKGFNLRTVVQWLRSQTRTPILTGLPHGHVPTKVLLPVGATVDLQMQGRECLILWGHI